MVKTLWTKKEAVKNLHFPNHFCRFNGFPVVLTRKFGFMSHLKRKINYLTRVNSVAKRFDAFSKTNRVFFQRSKAFDDDTSSFKRGRFVKNVLNFDKHFMKRTEEELFSAVVTVNGFLQHLLREETWKDKIICSWISNTSSRRTFAVYRSRII